MYKAIIFDFGGVILRHKTALIKDILSEMFPNAYDKANEVWEKYKLDLNTGKASSEDLIKELASKVPTNHSFDELKTMWLELYKKEASDVDWALLDFIEKLKGKYKIYLMTDTIDVHDKYNSERKIYHKFDNVYKSFEVGMAKVGGKAAFLNVLKKINAKPEKCVFVDDLESNVKVAEEVGMKGIFYQNLEQLKKHLASLGIEE